MENKIVKEKLYSYIGNDNISRYFENDGMISIVLKDSSIVDLHKIEMFEEVESISLNRNKVKVMLRLTEEGQKMAANKFKETAASIVALIGGKENISFCTHCVTRVRFNLKNKDLADIQALKELNGTMGAQWSGEQLQVIIGPGVEKVYEETCAIANISQSSAIDENLDAPKEKFTIKGMGNKILNALSGTLTGVIPAMVTVGILMFINNVLGPSMLNILSVESDLYQLFNTVANVGLASLPVFVAISGSKKFNCNIVVAVLLAVFMMSAEYTNLASTGTFTVYGIPMIAGAYASQVMPMFLITCAMGYIEKYLRKFIPDMFMTFEPVVCILIMLPIALCVLGPIGTVLGQAINTFVLWMNNTFGAFGVAVIGALFIPLIGTGMHLPVITTAVVTLTSFGYDDTILVGAVVATYVMIAIDLVYVLKAKNSDERGLGITCLVTQTFVGLGEPTIFGILFRYKKALFVSMFSTFCGALYLGFTHCAVYMMPISNVLVASVYSGGDSSTNFINGVIGCALGFAVALVLMYIVGFEDKKEK